MFLKTRGEVPSGTQCLEPSQDVLLAHSMLLFLKGTCDVRVFKRKS